MRGDNRGMFEAVVSLCLLSDPGICRDAVIPGTVAATVEDCQTALAAGPDPQWPEDVVAGAPNCAPVGPAAAFEEVALGVFVHLGVISEADPQNAGDVSNIGFIVGERAVAVIDSGGSRAVGEAVYRAVRAQTDLPIAYVILTHMHPDHVLGTAALIEPGTIVVGHAALPRALQDRQESYLASFGRLVGADGFLGTEVTFPDLLVSDHLTLDLGGRVLELRAWPNAHTGSDLTVGDPASGILFTGDLMFHTHAPALDGSVLGWRAVLTDMQALPYDHIVPGHGGPLLDWPAAATPLAAYLDLLIADTRAAIAAGEPLAQATTHIAAGQAEAWQLFDLFNTRNATVAYTELEWE